MKLTLIIHSILISALIADDGIPYIIDLVEHGLNFVKSIVFH